ncbi:putative potassium channel, voltage-dependent, EAG/ELK/ERG, rmlC-like jelly roll [Helianthus annuus]|uniref:Potassium channel, voltage-dependent, EAG/ELK/ERG, rmlC-like jelly roll n=1 Tax=Helianthus annuus TaxID=4232 RepID=A0A251VCA8_HELAN|nr:cyclic nucleotide-gated ion channel 1 [Helianthus annuus]KAF5816816.1 putative potassium channel, voltage-dependent, EAG/ELK/ERG, rmlC-like jelly roll [Helianthus annuus]KAJ0610079.1 putative cyclic nucleotide-binding domain, potassium channel, voltage-dependent, EAG/ELK/ERG [Helianthus annuus]
MKFKQQRYVRFKDTTSDYDQPIPTPKMKPSFIRRGLANDKTLLLPKTKKKKIILHPQGPFLQTWNKIFVVITIIAVSLDPLFFYIPVFDRNEKCLGMDNKMKIISCVLRTLVDLFYALHIIFEFRTGFIAPFSRVFGRGLLIEDSFAIAKRYLCSYFIIDIFSILPLPQVTILFIIPNSQGPISLVTKDLLKFVIFCQYIPRFVRMIPLYRQVTRTSGIFTETPWAGAVLNLFVYMLGSHVIGSFWYLFSIDRADDCFRAACNDHMNCDARYLYCGENRKGDYSFLNTTCAPLKPDQIKNSTDFDFGIFLDAFESHVVETKDFPQKFLYCFWWGLRSLSSLGQNLKTSTYVWETLFALSISILGLVLFSFLLGNMQKYLQSMTVRVEEMRVKRRDAELWMSHRMLPEDLKERVRRYEQYRWQENRGVDEESLIYNLPKDLRRDIKRHLCLSLLTRVPMFETMDERLLDAMSECLKPVLYTENSYIVREGDPVDEMLFIMRGDLLTVTTNGGRSGFFNSSNLKAGDFCGDELLTWALDPNLSSTLPLSTTTVRVITDVEAFSLKANDLKIVASQFRRLHSKRFQHTFRYYSQHWRTWGACFIQAAWRRHCRRKQEKALWEAEVQDALANTAAGTSPSLGAAIYASRFAANILHNLRRTNHSLTPKLSPLPLKPVDPDFSR